MKNYIYGLFLLVGMGLAAVGCETLSQNKNGTYYGPEETVGDGTARAWVTYKEDKPVALGVRLHKSALKGLSMDADPNHGEHVLQFPREAKKLPFNHVGLNWNPQGHDPSGIYDLPHFDVHFYMIDQKERDQIVPEDSTFERKIAHLPTETYKPAGYVPTEGVPRMGMHWVDPQSEEFHGKPFTRTFIYGTYDGRLIFFEPMVTVDYLASKQKDDRSIAQPQQFEKDGDYPTRYVVDWDENQQEHIIGLAGFKTHNKPMG